MCYEAARGPNGRYYRNNGVWHDQLRRSGDGWVFTHRTYQYLWLDLSPLPETHSCPSRRHRSGECPRPDPNQLHMPVLWP
jgi:hypothetical protein